MRLNVVENKISEFLKKFPLLKKNIKVLYQYLSYLLSKHKKEHHLINPLKEFSLNGSESFFGYYDKSPINSDGKFVLFHTTEKVSNKKPARGTVDVVIYDLNEGTLKTTLKTKTWNWQQGARLQWLTHDLFAFNDFDEITNTFIAKVYNVSNEKEVKRFQFPIQDTYEKWYFLSLNYTRLNTLRPDYGYRNLQDLNDQQIHNLEDDGIWYVDYETGEGHLLISLKEIVEFKYQTDFEGGKHYVNHIMISPNGQKFIFLHRYFKKGVRYDRLIQSDLKGNMVLLSDHELVSHYYWYGNDHVFGYMRGPDGKYGYYMISCSDRNMKLYEDDELQKFGDGHPNIHGNHFVTDNYPDKSRTQSLIYGSLKSKKHKVIAQLHNGLKYRDESRCDLHPRLSQDGKMVFFDTVHSGKRKLCMMKLDNITIE